MKTTYTRNDIQRMATEKAMEILAVNKEMLLNNISCGWNKGQCLMSLANDTDHYRATKTIYIVLEYEGSWIENKVNLCVYEEVYKEMNKEINLIEVIEKFYGIRSKNGEDIFLTDEDGYNKHQQREMNKYSSKDIHYNIKMNTELNLKLKKRIERDTGKKIKKQDLIVRKQNQNYVISYDYRNIRKTLFI